MGDDKNFDFRHLFSLFSPLSVERQLFLLLEMSEDPFEFYWYHFNITQPTMDRSLSINYAKRDVTWHKTSILEKRQTTSSLWRLLCFSEMKNRSLSSFITWLLSKYLQLNHTDVPCKWLSDGRRTCSAQLFLSGLVATVTVLVSWSELQLWKM